MSETPQSGANSETAYLQQRLPFSSSDVDEALSSELSSSYIGRSMQRRARSGSITSSQNISSSYNRQPTRSYFHHATHYSHDSLHYSSQGVREQTQELASWALGSESSRGRGGAAISSSSRSGSENNAQQQYPVRSDADHEGRPSTDSTRPGAIAEASEPNTPDTGSGSSVGKSSGSALSNMFKPKKQPLPQTYFSIRSRSARSDTSKHGPSGIVVEDEEEGETESTALLAPTTSRRSGYKSIGYSHRPWLASKGTWYGIREPIALAWSQVRHPASWDVQNIAKSSIGALSAVFLGVLLNLLDALSYGMILFPLGESIFEKTGPDGISMFYVSCIVSQLTYSLGGTAFRGGVGSEMIEVVPFFHKMAYVILDHMGEDDPEAVLATTIVSYALSSILTGVIFLLLGALRLGDLVSFFPRSILLGCIGGVGVFLVLTGIEVSAGLDSSMEWGVDTFQRLFYPSTFALWVLPVALAVTLMVIRHYLTHPVVLPAFFLSVFGIFYIVTAAVPTLNLDLLRENGWVFHAPEAGVPFYNFYSYYKFSKVNWEAISLTIPTMFALSFFGIIHVPINVPALGIAVQMDDVNINRELFGHGLSNALSGFVGSIQNYLVFANSRLFIQNGGNSRSAGVLLAIATTGIWVAGPTMIGYIPILIVGTLIFMLGIEMVQEALWDTFGKIQTLEYLMVLAITVVMGFYDFVVGIVLGIVLACLIFVVQNSQISAVRGTYSGAVVESTVRRHLIQRRFLHEVGSQIKLIKLSGYLFFGSIVAVERRVRAMIEEEAFLEQPIRYLVLDFGLVQGLDFSAAEAFVRMDRVLQSREVEMVLSGVSLSGDIGKSLVMVGLLDADEERKDYQPPRIFEDLNQALEACENELLIALKQRSEQLVQQKKGTVTKSLAIPTHPDANALAAANTIHNSPRSHHLSRAATTTLSNQDLTIPPKWQSFAQPLPLLLQAFKDVTTKDYDFWHRATPYFTRKVFAAGTIVFSRGQFPDSFYLLEEGILRADHDLEQGRYAESILAGTMCGELPFFAESKRTATVVAETDCVAWMMDQAGWDKLEREQADVTTEMLRVGLKLTNERMNSITSYVLLMSS